MKRLCSFVAGLALLAAVVPARSQAATEPQAAAGQALVKRYADAIIGVELVVTIRVKQGDREAPPREQRIEINGTVISPTGLTVTTLSGVDPQVQFESIRALPQGRNLELLGADFKEVKLRLADGREIPARFVLKDADLDLAFMAPETTESGTTFTHVKLSDAAEGVVLGGYYFVGRAPKMLQRIPLVRQSQIMGIIEKPRRFYLLTEQMVGTPMLDPEGKVLGISVQNFSNNRPTGLVVIPATDIAEMAKQAAAAQNAPKSGG